MKYLIACAAALLATHADAARYLEISFDVRTTHADFIFDTTDPSLTLNQVTPDGWTAIISAGRFDFAFAPPSYLIVYGGFDLSPFDLTGSSFHYALHNVDGYEEAYLAGGYRDPTIVTHDGKLYNINIIGTDQTREPGIVITGYYPEPPIPEPSSWALMLVGFGAVGGALRSRRKIAVSFG